MRKMLTEVLLEVTNDEISDVAYSVHVKASKGKAYFFPKVLQFVEGML